MFTNEVFTKNSNEFKSEQTMSLTRYFLEASLGNIVNIYEGFKYWLKIFSWSKELFDVLFVQAVIRVIIKFQLVGN